MTDLFEPWTVGSMTSRNRFVRSATAESLCTKEGCPTALLNDVYSSLSEGGIGTIITGYCYVTPDGKPAERTPNISSDAFAKEFLDLVDATHKGGASIVAQLVYGGSKSKLASNDSRFIKEGASSIQDGQPNVSILGPSAVANPATGLVPTEATADQLKSLALAFGDAAKRAKAWGFDGVEIHGAHGYLLSQFLNPNFNRRSDQYGGSIENRARFVCECVRATRFAVGPEFPIFVKLNSCDVFDDPEGKEGGLSEAESVCVANFLADAGASVIEVSGDWHSASKEIKDHQPYFGRFASALAEKLSISVMVTGGWRELPIMEAYMRQNKVAALGLSRPLIREPYLVNRWKDGNRENSLCVECDICQKQAGIPCPYR